MQPRKVSKSDTSDSGRLLVEVSSGTLQFFGYDLFIIHYKMNVNIFNSGNSLEVIIYINVLMFSSVFVESVINV